VPLLPLVIIQIWSKTWKVPMIPTITTNSVTGLSSGRVICRVVCQAEAPSILAASSSSGGMPCRPASSKMTPKPMNCQVSTTNIVYSTMVGLASHSWTAPPSPTAFIS